MLPLSHDEVVHLKGSLLHKMPGDEWQKFANLRALFGFQWAHPGTHILFMGGEIGQTTEWSHDLGVPWHLLEHKFHSGVQQWVADLNAVYTSRPALWRHAFSPEGFEWVSGDDSENSVMTFLRKGDPQEPSLLVVCHFGANAIESYRVGLPYGGEWVEILNSDDTKYGGSGQVNAPLNAEAEASHGREYSITFKLAPLSVQIFEGIKPPNPKAATAKKVSAVKEKPAKPVKKLKA